MDNKEGLLARCIEKLKSLHLIVATPRHKTVRDSARLAATSINTVIDQKAPEIAIDWKPSDDGEECPICCESKPPAQILALQKCSHRVCCECVSRHVEVQLQANKVPVVCPHTCAEHLDLDQCRPHLSAKVGELLEIRLIEATIPDSEKIYCPFPNCSALMIVIRDRETRQSAECMECHRLFCMECLVSWHPGMSCAVYKNQEKDRKEDATLLRIAKEKKWRRCLRCGAMVERKDGCSHIYCRCKHEFCYHCGAEWQNKKATCKCKLYG